MNAAALTSPRLQRVLALLRDGRSHTTRDVVRRASVCAVNAIMAELRHHGAEIVCTQQRVGGKRRFFYKMIKGPKT